MKLYWKYIVISLLIGGFAGSALTLVALQYRHGGPGRGLGHMRQKLYRELQLSPEQRTKVDSIIQTSRQKMEELRRATRSDIRKVLQPDQQASFDKLDAKMEARRKKWLDRGPGK